MPETAFTYQDYGRSAVLVSYKEPYNFNGLMALRGFAEMLRDQDVLAIQDINYCYRSLLVQFKEQSGNKAAYMEQLRQIESDLQSRQLDDSGTLWEIPVCYDESLGPDQHLVLEHNNISRDDLIRLHTASDYLVYGIGFLPGFLYLGGLHKKLQFPRKETPRLSVLKGSVGIADAQTGIYPMASPGGWNLIGRSPVILFNSMKAPPTPVQPGDQVRFTEIDIKTFRRFEKTVDCQPLKIDSKS
jgi:inhibitor of KinA